MKSFRHELEDLNNPVVEQDIYSLSEKIYQYKEGKIPEEKFRSLRLARGVYGQRQQGVQMVRIKIPFGKLTVKQLIRIADVADEYSNGNLHTTTRQDIQIHHVSLDRTPQLWAELEKDSVTLREACGNTVRNITASPYAGIDPEEPFDVSPYANALFKYLLRNPANQELGRKFKIAFSSNENDNAYGFIHDLGFIPRIRNVNNKERKGFKVLIGGGLGAQPYSALTAFEFLPEEKIIPFTAALIRVFDRYGERAKRHKARFKFLLEQYGIEKILSLTETEKNALPFGEYFIDQDEFEKTYPPRYKTAPQVPLQDIDEYDRWLKSNVKEQKQRGYFSLSLKLQTGDLKTAQARTLASLVKEYAADDIRVTINQGLILKYIVAENLPYVFTELKKAGLAGAGADSVTDITTCPGTDTCNLGITSSYGVSRELERILGEEYPDLIYNNDIKIKVSGCMNSCGQHVIAQIGFHGSTLKSGNKFLPALQVLLGGGLTSGRPPALADKVIKVPSKRAPGVLRTLLDDYEEKSEEGEYFNDYYRRNGKIYFYELLKPFADLTNIRNDEFIDWEQEESWKQAIGVGECAGVTIDLIATLLYETEEKLDLARKALLEARWADSIYFSYSTFISGAKTWLVNQDIKTNTQSGIVNDFDGHAISSGKLSFAGTFSDSVYRINKNSPGKIFAQEYFQDAENFLKQISTIRKKELEYAD